MKNRFLLLVLILVLLLFVACLGPDGGDNDGDITLSGKLAFMSYDDYYGEIYTVNADGSGLVRITNNTNVYDQYPSWSPDGNKIAYVSSTANTCEVYVVNIEDLSTIQITHDVPREDDYGYTYNMFGEDWPSWSPDGNSIVFESYRDNPFENSGTSIANANLYVANSNGSGGDIRITSNLYYEGMPSWSPNGDKIAFIHSVEPVNSYSEGYHLYIMNSDGSNWERITTSGYNVQYPKFSPDGEKIVYTNDGEISIYNIEDQTITSLGIYGGYPSWSPDGTMIVYNYSNEIYIVDLDGNLVKKITLDVGARQVVWTDD